MTEDYQVKPVADIVLEGSPCSLAVDNNDQLWVVQSNEDQTVVVFEIKYEGNQHTVRFACKINGRVYCQIVWLEFTQHSGNDNCCIFCCSSSIES